MVVSDEQLKEFRKTIQEIIDKHLPKDKVFSVEHLNSEGLWYVSRLLLEKDEEMRVAIRNELKEKIKGYQKDEEEQYLDILKNKEIFDTIFNTVDDMNNLSENVGKDYELENQINDL